MTPPTITPLESYAALPGDTTYGPVIFADVHDQTAEAAQAAEVYAQRYDRERQPPETGVCAILV